MKKSAFCLLAIFLTSAFLVSCDDMDRKCNDPEKCRERENCEYRQRGYDCGRGW